MTALVVFILLFATLFALAFVTKRRFGVLGLALCAGSLLSTSWATALTPLIEKQGITLIAPPLWVVVAASLILLPALLLLFSGPTYSSMISRVAGAALFALLALVFLLRPFGTALLFDSLSLQIYNTLLIWSDMVIMVSIVVAIVDLFLTRNPKAGKKSK